MQQFKAWHPQNYQNVLSKLSFHWKQFTKQNHYALYAGLFTLHIIANIYMQKLQLSSSQLLKTTTWHQNILKMTKAKPDLELISQVSSLKLI